MSNRFHVHPHQKANNSVIAAELEQEARTMMTNIRTGAVAGVAGGIPFGMMMTAMGSMKMVAGMVGSESTVLGWLVHLMISLGLGVGFGLFRGLIGIGGNRALVLGGLGYGVFWWFLGPLTLMPLMMGMPLGWNGSAMSAMLPSLFGHMIFGGVMGYTYLRLTSSRARLSLVGS